MYEKIFTTAKNNGISQKELAAHLEVSPSVLSDWKRGRIKPSTEIIFQIANFLNVSTDYLLGKSNKPNRVELMDDIEFGFIEGYRQLDDEDREELNRAAQRMLELKKLRENQQ